MIAWQALLRFLNQTEGLVYWLAFKAVFLSFPNRPVVEFETPLTSDKIDDIPRMSRIFGFKYLEQFSSASGLFYKIYREHSSCPPQRGYRTSK